MNPFGRSELGERSPLTEFLRRFPAPLALMLTLSLGLGIVAWRAWSGALNRRAHARAEATGIAAALELQIHQAISAVELLGVQVQHEGATLDFPKAAAQVMATRPGIVSLELQPGGVVK